MRKYCFKPEEMTNRLEPRDMGLVYTSLQRIEVNGSIQIESKEEEVGLFILAGSVDYTFMTQKGQAGFCDLLYLPIHSEIELSGEHAAVIRFGAPCNRSTSFAHIRFKDVDAGSGHQFRGDMESGTKREVWKLLDETFDSSRFLIGITFGAKAGWTTWPPHEHGNKREEVYLYFNMDDGFGIQCVYDESNKQEDAFIVRNGYAVAISGGFHPNVGCPKKGIGYVFCMVSVKAEDRNSKDVQTQAIYAG